MYPALAAVLGLVFAVCVLHRLVKYRRPRWLSAISPSDDAVLAASSVPSNSVADVVVTVDAVDEAALQRLPKKKNGKPIQLPALSASEQWTVRDEEVLMDDDSVA